MGETTVFSAWYRGKLGGLPLAVQALLWFLYGFIWIPAWYFASTPARGDDARTASVVEPAPAWKRLAGYVADVALGFGLGLAVVAGALTPREQREVGAIFVLVTPFYSTMLLEGLFGWSVGKLLTGTRVVTVDGLKPGWGRVVLRMFVRLIPLEPLSLRNGVMWHDRLSGTRVAEREAIAAAVAAPGRVAEAVGAGIDATHDAAASLERAGLADRARELRASAAAVQSSLLGNVDPGGYAGQYRLLKKRTPGGGVVFWIRDAGLSDDNNFLFNILLGEAANLPEEFRRKFLQGSTYPQRRTVQCPNGGYELHIDLRP